MKRSIYFLVALGFLASTTGCALTRVVDPFYAAFESEEKKAERQTAREEAGDLCPDKLFPILARAKPEERAPGNDMPAFLMPVVWLMGTAVIGVGFVATGITWLTDGSEHLGLNYSQQDYKEVWFRTVSSVVHGIRTGETYWRCVDGEYVDWIEVCEQNGWEC